MNKENPWERTEQLIGPRGIQTLHTSNVTVVGLGGVGSYAVEALARAGIGELCLIDGDVLAWSNMNRQLLATHQTMGQAKVEAAARRIADINPCCITTARNMRVTPENAAELLEPRTDYIIDAIDDLPAKAALIAAAKAIGVPIISVLGTARRLDPWTGFQQADISTTHTCPLARALRKRLRLLGIETGVSVIYSPQPPHQLPQATRESQECRPPLGSISFVPGQAGLIAAGIVVNALLEKAN